MISPFHVLNCNLILRQHASSFGLFRRASYFNTSLSFTLCLNAQNLGIDSILSLQTDLYDNVPFLHSQVFEISFNTSAISLLSLPPKNN